MGRASPKWPGRRDGTSAHPRAVHLCAPLSLRSLAPVRVSPHSSKGEREREGRERERPARDVHIGGRDGNTGVVSTRDGCKAVLEASCWLRRR